MISCGLAWSLSGPAEPLGLPTLPPCSRRRVLLGKPGCRLAKHERTLESATTLRWKNRLAMARFPSLGYRFLRQFRDSPNCGHAPAEVSVCPISWHVPLHAAIPTPLLDGRIGHAGDPMLTSKGMGEVLGADGNPSGALCSSPLILAGIAKTSMLGLRQVLRFAARSHNAGRLDYGAVVRSCSSIN